MNNLPVVKLKPAFHREQQVVQLIFDKHNELNNLLRSNTNMRWSKTMNCWYVSFYKNISQDLFKLLNPTYYLDCDDLKNNQDEFNTIHQYEQGLKLTETPTETLAQLSTDVLQKVEGFRMWLNSKRYSQNTIETYVDALSIFLRYYAHKPISDITNDNVIVFNNDYILAKGLSSSFQNQIVNAIKLFFKTVEHRKIEVDLIHRPKREKVLPNVLSKEEVKLILNSHGNIKHRAMLSLIYSCGLRCGELLRLTINDIDSKRGIVIIRQSKGRKDRIAPLSSKIIEMLREYYTIYKPKYYLFEGQIKNTMYDERSLQQVLKQSLKKSGITKPVSLHWLRHSYATHLLESGTDLRYIQEILGHSSSRTTEIYTHVSTKSIQNITSPFDYL